MLLANTAADENSKMAQRLYQKRFSTDDFSTTAHLCPQIGGYDRLVCLRSTNIIVERGGVSEIWGLSKGP
jgi:hypothetical protein